ncbi:MAG: hypothetical protein JSR54_14900, partial [Proteobacteria bacterium]|nr:hypothetical protein [Pseudomonadota bacterium]
MAAARAPIVRFRSTAAEAAGAARDIAPGGAGAALTVLFASSDHDLGALGGALEAAGC